MFRACAVSGEDFTFFESKIRPLLIERCYECHSLEKKVKGGLRLDTKQGWATGGDLGPVIVPGNPDASLLIKAVRYHDPDLRMPPKGKLSAEEIGLLVSWVQQGAPDPRENPATGTTNAGLNIAEGKQFWSFRSPVMPLIPATKSRTWPRTDIDRFILARLEEKKIKPVQDAASEDLFRRLHFDLIGLPPNARELADFKRLPSATRLTQTVDRLLASPRFGEKWGRHWLDVARYAESTGGGRSAILAHAWRYRNYVIDSFNRDKPYDQFLQEQIAGDLLPAKDSNQKNEQLIATGFLALGPKNLDLQDKEQLRMNTVDEQIDTIGRAVLAMTLGCARCHDHKFDPIPARDYYALAGILRSTKSLVRDNVSRLVESTLAIPAVTAAREQHTKSLAALKKQITKAKASVEKNDGAAANLKMLETELKELEAKSVPQAKAICVTDEEQPTDYNICVRGNVHQLGPAVPRGFLEVASTSPAPPTIATNESGRRELAQWLTSTNNPLTARVYVNRVWQRLFGRGLVHSTDNFGRQGEKPTHPELLDFLALRFMQDGWSTRKLIREMVLSHVYQLSADDDSACRDVDPENYLRWRMPRRQLDAEALRDAILLVSGDLELRQVDCLLPEDLQSDSALRRTTTKVEDLLNPPLRSVYIPVFREEGMNDLMEVFDFANPSFTVTERTVSTLPTQALFLMNSPFVMEQALRTAQRAIGQKQVSDKALLQELYLRTLGRLPSREETKLALRHADENSGDPVVVWAGIIHTLFASVDFRYLN